MSENKNHAADQDQDDFDPAMLKKLIHEMLVTIRRQAKFEDKEYTRNEIPDDPFALKMLIEEMAAEITNQSNDGYLKAIVNSIFDTVSVKETTEMLKEYNSNNPPTWLYTIDRKS